MRKRLPRLLRPDRPRRRRSLPLARCEGAPFGATRLPGLLIHAASHALPSRGCALSPQRRLCDWHLSVSAGELRPVGDSPETRGAFRLGKVDPGAL